LGKPEQAVAILDPRKSEFKLPSSYFLLGEALEGTGDAKGAVDAYLEAATRPWSNQKQATEALEKLWRTKKMGTRKDLQARINTTVEHNFGDADYVPRLLQHPAPKFDLTTLGGERFTNSQLTGKIVVVNFWAVWCGPCLTELQPLQDFQRNHPDLIVLTVVGDDTDSDQLQKIIRNEKLRNLRISLAPQNFWQQFGALGIPNTFVIDKTGTVRTQHYGGIPDVERYLSADIAAITKSM
jgi:thiol-disulfide isomerase/thioredoxin